MCVGGGGQVRRTGYVYHAFWPDVDLHVHACGTLKCENAAICENVAKCEKNLR